MKNAIALLLLSAIPALCGEALSEGKPVEAWKRKSFTLEELRRSDGKEGRPAYVAVDGVVYDMSGVHAWKGGGHMGKHAAGEDLSRAFHEKAPKRIHIDGKVLEGLPKVGVVGDEPKSLCPVCKMPIEGGKPVKFCSPACRKAFEKDANKPLGPKKGKKSPKKGK